MIRCMGHISIRCRLVVIITHIRSLMGPIRVRWWRGIITHHPWGTIGLGTIRLGAVAWLRVIASCQQISQKNALFSILPLLCCSYSIFYIFFQAKRKKVPILTLTQKYLIEIIFHFEIEKKIFEIEKKSFLFLFYFNLKKEKKKNWTK